MTTLRLRHIAEVNPLTPAFDRLAPEAKLTFLPMEAVWPGERLDISRRRAKESVATGYTRFQDGDVLVPKITPTFEAGRAVLIHGLYGGVGAGSTELHVLRAGPRIDSRFLLYVVNTHPFLKLGEAEMYGVAGQQRVPDSFLRDLPVELPELSEQRRIADFLDAETAQIDRLVEITQQQVDLLDEWLMERLRRATTVGGSTEIRRTGVPWMPEMAAGWDLWRVGHAFSTGSGTTPSSGITEYFGGDHYWVNTGDLRDGVVRHPMKTVTDKALAAYTTLKIYPVDSLVVAMYGATTGRVGVLGVPACVNQACCVLSELGSVSSQYAFLWFRAHREEILRLASGGGQPNISQDLVRNLRIPAPLREQQEHVARQARGMVQAVSDRQDLLRKRETLLAERRQALITAAVTGQIDVSTAGGRGIED